MPPSRRYGITGMMAPIAKAAKLDPPAASGEPIVSPDSPISSRTKVSRARPWSSITRSTMSFASADESPLAM